jgi:hypothetical protein
LPPSPTIERFIATLPPPVPPAPAQAPPVIVPPPPTPPPRGLGPTIRGGHTTAIISTRRAYEQNVAMINNVINLQHPTVSTKQIHPTLTGNKQEHLNLLACPVFDEETGCMFNYRQLLTHPKHKKEVWH